MAYFYSLGTIFELEYDKNRALIKWLKKHLHRLYIGTHRHILTAILQDFLQNI